jgi:hypothetical protein
MTTSTRGNNVIAGLARTRSRGEETKMSRGTYGAPAAWRRPAAAAATPTRAPTRTPTNFLFDQRPRRVRPVQAMAVGVCCSHMISKGSRQAR